MDAVTAATKFTPRCVWIPSTVPESTPPPYPVSCAATPSREIKWIHRSSASTTGTEEKLRN